MYINPINDSPILEFILDQYIAEDDSLSLVINATDIDNIDLLYDASLIEGSGVLALDNNQLLFVQVLGHKFFSLNQC